jgi:hypothetical protein
VPGTSVLSLNTWTFLAGTYDGSTLKLYVNGTLDASKAKRGAITTTADPLRLGGDWSGEMFTGILDNVRVYNVALTQSQIQSDMNGAVSGGQSTASVGSTATFPIPSPSSATVPQSTSSLAAGPVSLDSIKSATNLAVRSLQFASAMAQPREAPVVFSALNWRSRAMVLTRLKPRWPSLFNEGS